MTLAALRTTLDFRAVPADHAELRAAFGLFPSGVAALCAMVGDEPVGLVATSFSVGVSFDPPLVSFSVQGSSSSWPKLRTADRIGVSVLGEQHAAVALQLSSRRGDRFAGLAITRNANQSVFIADAAVWFDCEVVSETQVGDHSIVVMEVKSLKSDDVAKPLIYHGLTFRELA